MEGHDSSCEAPYWLCLVQCRWAKAVFLTDLSACEVSSPIPACLCFFCGSRTENEGTQNIQMGRNNSSCMRS